MLVLIPLSSVGHILGHERVRMCHVRVTCMCVRVRVGPPRPPRPRPAHPAALQIPVPEVRDRRALVAREGHPHLLDKGEIKCLYFRHLLLD